MVLKRHPPTVPIIHSSRVRPVLEMVFGFFSKSEEKKKTVADLDDEELGEMIAATLDAMTAAGLSNGTVPTTPEIIKHAQKALVAMKVEGDLSSRTKDIDKVLDMLLDDVE